MIHKGEVKPEDKASLIDKFEIYKTFSGLIKPSNEYNYLLSLLAKERVNEFNWKELNTSIAEFNDLYKQNNWWEKLYNVSRKSIIDNEKYGLMLLKINGKYKLFETSISNFLYDEIAEELVMVEGSFSNIKLAGSDRQVNIKFVKENSIVIPRFIIDGNEINPKYNSEIALQFGLDFSFDSIPIVIWKSSPFNDDEFSIQKNIAKELEFINTLIHDQLIQNLTKKVKDDTETGSGIKNIEGNEKEFTDIVIERLNSLDPNQPAGNLIYGPSDSLKRYFDAYDFKLNKFKEFSKSVRDDDQDSAQKTISEVWSINRSGTSQLEINKFQFEKNIKLLINIMFKYKIVEEVNLPFNTVGEAIKNTAQINSTNLKEKENNE